MAGSRPGTADRGDQLAAAGTAPAQAAPRATKPSRPAAPAVSYTSRAIVLSVPPVGANGAKVTYVWHIPTGDFRTTSPRVELTEVWRIYTPRAQKTGPGPFDYRYSYDQPLPLCSARGLRPLYRRRVRHGMTHGASQPVRSLDADSEEANLSDLDVRLVPMQTNPFRFRHGKSATARVRIKDQVPRRRGCACGCRPTQRRCVTESGERAQRRAPLASCGADTSGGR